MCCFIYEAKMCDSYFNYQSPNTVTCIWRMERKQRSSGPPYCVSNIYLHPIIIFIIFITTTKSCTCKWRAFRVSTACTSSLMLEPPAIWRFCLSLIENELGTCAFHVPCETVFMSNQVEGSCQPNLRTVRWEFSQFSRWPLQACTKH